jgi:hypothetical protein
VKNKFRGFSEESESRGFKNITKYMKDNIETLEKDSND